MKKNIKTYSILFLLLIVVCLVVYGVIYASKNYNRGDIMTLKTNNIKKTLKSDQLDVLPQPNPALPLAYKELPKADKTINEIDYKTFKKIFQTEGKSLLVLVKDGCAFCERYLPVFENTLSELNIKAYKINITNLSESNLVDIFKYIDYDGTPTTFTIINGKATHSLTGLVDSETLKAFIDYYYLRNN